MDEISGKRLDGRLADITQGALEPEAAAAKPPAEAPPAPTAAFPDQITAGIGGPILNELSAAKLAPATEPADGAPPPVAPELAGRLDTQLAMARLKEDALLQGETASAPPAEPPPAGPATPPVIQSAASGAVTQAALAAEDVLERMYERAQSILDAGFTRADEIIQFSESAALQIETQGAQDADSILNTAREQAERIRQRAYEEYQPPTIGLPSEGTQEPPPSIGLPVEGDETPVGEPSGWDDMLRDLFNKAMAEADDVLLRGQTESESVLAQARELADQTREDGQLQALDVRQTAVNASNRIHEYGRNISVNLRQEGIKHADFTQFREELQRADIRDQDFRNTLQRELRSLDDLVAQARRPGRSD